MAWLRPIIDRTQADVDEAIRILQEWKTSGTQNMTDLKGCFNVSDINRIEGNIRYLANELFNLCYSCPVNTNTTWSKDKFLTDVEVDRVLSNVNALVRYYYQPPNSPMIPDSVLTYEQVNDLEHNIYLIKQMLDNMIDLFKQCGTVECGEA